jgi:hypothetical protein
VFPPVSKPRTSAQRFPRRDHVGDLASAFAHGVCLRVEFVSASAEALGACDPEYSLTRQDIGLTFRDTTDSEVNARSALRAKCQAADMQGQAGGNRERA